MAPERIDTRSLRDRITAELPDYPPGLLPAEARTPGELMETLYAYFAYAITHLRNEFMQRRDLESARATALRRLGEMEEVLPSLQRRDPLWMPEQWRRATILCVLVAELVTWANEIESIQCFASTLAHGVKHPT